MADSFEPDTDSFEPEGGAEGGGGSDKMPSKALIRPKSEIPESPEDKKARELHEKRGLAASLSHGQSLAAMPADEREAYQNKAAEGALGEGIAFARGVPLTGAHIDELSALLQTGKVGGADYEKKLGDSRRAVNDAVKEHPASPVLGSLAFAGVLPATAPQRLALGAADGISEGVGAAPTMKDSIGPGIKGGLLGLATSAAGEGLIQGGKALGGKADAAREGARKLTDAQIDKAFGSARGAYGGNVASGNNLIQSAERMIADERLPQQLRDAAAQWLDTPEALALREQVGRSSLGRGEDALARISNSQNAMHEAAAKMTPEARSAAAAARVDDPSALMRRLRELGPKVVFPAVGGALGGPAGAAAGGLLGAVTGRSATTVRNLLADPYVATRLFDATGAATGAAGNVTSSLAPQAPRAWSRFTQPDEEQ